MINNLKRMINNLNRNQKTMIVRIILLLTPPLLIIAILTGPYLIGDNHFYFPALFYNGKQVSNSIGQSHFFQITNTLFLLFAITTWIASFYIIVKFPEVLAFLIKLGIFESIIFIIITAVLLINYGFFSYSDFSENDPENINIINVNILALFIFIQSIITIIYFSKLLKKEKELSK